MIFTSSGRKFTYKYKDETNYTDAAPVIRYAEVLLNMAEAHARKTSPDLTTSLNLLNQVRNRALANVATQAYTSTSFANASALVGAILKERRIEFLAEGLRWNTIHRLQHDDIAPINGVPQKYKNGANPVAADYKIGIPYVFKTGDVASWIA